MGDPLFACVASRAAFDGDGAGPLDDSVLCDRVREGTTSAAGRAAFGELYARYRDPAMAAAYGLTGCPDRAEDLVAEVFARVLRALAGGRGPYESVLGYLTVALRGEAASVAKAEHPIDLVDPEALDELLDVAAPDIAEALSEGDQVSRAFRTLPTAARRVLWLLDVEQVPFEAAADHLRTTPGALRMSLTRYRRRLATAYLQQYVHVADPRCLPAAGLLAAYTHGGIGVRKQRGVREHLAECSSCLKQARRLASLSGQFRGPGVPARSLPA